jgi:hypothetical protein
MSWPAALAMNDGRTRIPVRSRCREAPGIEAPDGKGAIPTKLQPAVNLGTLEHRIRIRYIMEYLYL